MLRIVLTNGSIEIASVVHAVLAVLTTLLKDKPGAFSSFWRKCKTLEPGHALHFQDDDAVLIELGLVAPGGLVHPSVQNIARCAVGVVQRSGQLVICSPVLFEEIADNPFVTLNSGVQEKSDTVFTTLRALALLNEFNRLAVLSFLSACRGGEWCLQAIESDLKDLGLLSGDGEISCSTRNIVLAAVRDLGWTRIELCSPL